MANLTIVVDDQLLQAARIKALQQGTSVNEVCREAIERFAGPSPRQRADELMAAFREVGRHVKPLPKGEKAWPGREALYEEVLSQRVRVEERSPASPVRRKAKKDAG
jgi:hypothetical protein